MNDTIIGLDEFKRMYEHRMDEMHKLSLEHPKAAMRMYIDPENKEFVSGFVITVPDDELPLSWVLAASCIDGQVYRNVSILRLHEKYVEYVRKQGKKK